MVSYSGSAPVVASRPRALTLPVVLLVTWLRQVAPDRRARERGDVPGWVLVTLMTAALCIALWQVAGPALTAAFTNAINSVSGLR